MRFSLAGLPAGSRRAGRKPGPRCRRATGLDARVTRLRCLILRPSKEVIRRPLAGGKNSGESRTRTAVPAGSLQSAKRRTSHEHRTKRFATTRWRKAARAASPVETDTRRQIVRFISRRFVRGGSSSCYWSKASNPGVSEQSSQETRKCARTG